MDAIPYASPNNVHCFYPLGSAIISGHYYHRMDNGETTMFDFFDAYPTFSSPPSASRPAISKVSPAPLTRSTSRSEYGVKNSFGYVIWLATERLGPSTSLARIFVLRDFVELSLFPFILKVTGFYKPSIQVGIFNSELVLCCTANCNHSTLATPTPLRMNFFCAPGCYCNNCT